MSGITGTQTELLYSLAVPVTKNNYTSPAPIGPLAATQAVPRIPGGFFAENPNPLGRALHGSAHGTIANAATAYTFSPTIALDSTAGTALNPITIYSAVAPTASITAQWDVEFWITCQAFGETAGMTLQINGMWGQSSVASGGALNVTGWTAQFAGTLSGLTPATTYFVELFGTWNTASASATTTLQQMFLWGLN